MAEPMGGSRRTLWPWLAIIPVLAVAAFQLRYQGRLWWCACGQPNLWAGDTKSSHNSQHVFDPYSLTHVLHGVIFYGLLTWGLPRMSLAWRLALAVSLEAGWEVFENTELVIQRYRTATLALGYQGDTVANSLGDVVSCAIGFLLARRLRIRYSVALFVAIEVVLLFWIRDSLLLNIVMLIHPMEAIKAWQMGH
jgi:hypothetical protein